MPLVSVGDLVILGPGSEWLWTMAQFIALGLTGLAIFRQLRSQRSASLYEHMAEWDQEWADVPMVRAKLSLLLELQHRDPSSGLPLLGDEVPDLFERLGYLVARGHINAEDFWQDGGWSVAEWYWQVLQPYIQSDREREPTAIPYAWFEWLERKMRQIDAEHGEAHPRFDESTRDAQIAARIEIFRLKLEREQPGWPPVSDRDSARRPRTRSAPTARER